MRTLVFILAALVLGPYAVAEDESQPIRFIIFNRLGPNFSEKTRETEAEALRQHVVLYRRLAREGIIEFGGRLEGEPALGISVTRPGVHRDQLLELLEESAITKGLIETEIREMEVQLPAPEEVG